VRAVPSFSRWLAWCCVFLLLPRARAPDSDDCVRPTQEKLFVLSVWRADALPPVSSRFSLCHNEGKGKETGTWAFPPTTLLRVGTIRKEDSHGFHTPAQGNDGIRGAGSGACFADRVPHSTLAFCQTNLTRGVAGVSYLWRHCARVADTWKMPYEACCSSVQVGSVNQSSALSWVPADAPILFNEPVVSGWWCVLSLA